MSRRDLEKLRVLAIWSEHPRAYLRGPDAQDTRNAFAVGSLRGLLGRLKDAHGPCGSVTCVTCSNLARTEGLFDALDEAAAG